MNQTATTKGPTGYFADQFDAPIPTNEEVIRQNAHVVNGGEATFQCPACKGSGRFRSYTGRVVGACFKCKGKGNVGKGVVAAAKGKQTKLANQAKWQADNADAIAYVRKRADKGSTFYAGFLDKLGAYGTLTEGQLALVYKDMAKDAEFFAKKKAEREAAAPTVEISAIEALFATAIENDVKRPIYRAESIEISRAPATGKNAGALYVKRDGEYAGKVVGGKFQAVYGAPADTLDRLMAVAADPLKESMAYGRKFGNCGLCGRGLVDPVSIRAGVGPICSEKWGLDWKRDDARQSLADDEEQEKFMRIALALALLATPALADTSLPPAKYDLAPNATTVAAIEDVELTYFHQLFPTYQVPVGRARDKCDQLSLARWGTPYPASEIPGGSTLMGCLIRDNDDGNPVIVISYDPQRPELAPRLLRHELGHLCGWPGNHPR